MNKLWLFPTPFWSKLSSFLMALIVSALILILPNMVVGEDGIYSHSFVSLVMIAISGCYVHGIGFVPKNIVALVLFSPYLCWPILLLALYSWVF